MTSTDASPSSTPFITRLPFELLSEIFQKVEREDLAHLYATTRTFSRIVRPLLFRDLSFKTAQSIRSSLLGIAGTPELADLVRNLNVSFNLKPPQKPEDRDQILNIIAISLISFRTLERVSSINGWGKDEQFFINDSLQLAIFLHPTLRSLSYEGWHSSLTSYNTSFRRTQSHPLIIQRLCYEYPPSGYRPDFFEPHQFYSTILPFISHFECQVQLLELSSLQPDGFPLPLLLETPIAGLKHLSIISSEDDRPPDLLIKTDWLARFLDLHPVRTLRLVRTDTGNREEIDLPWLAFSFVKGLEVFSDNELVSWEEVDTIEDLQVQFSEGEEREVHGLDLELLAEYVDIPLTTSTVRGLVQAFPNLRRLEFYGSYSTPELHETISALAGLQHLSELRIASHLLEEDRRSFCHHQADSFLEELTDASEESTLTSSGIPLDSQTREDLRLRLLTADLHRPRKLSWFIDGYEEDWRTLFAKLPRLEELKWALEVGRGYGAREELCVRRREITSSAIFDVESQARLKRVVCWCNPRTTSDDWISMLLARPPLFR